LRGRNPRGNSGAGSRAENVFEQNASWRRVTNSSPSGQIRPDRLFLSNIAPTVTTRSENSSPTRHQNYPFLWHFKVCTTRKNKAGKGFNCVDDRIHTVEVIGSNPIAPTIPVFSANLPVSGSLRLKASRFNRAAKLAKKDL